MESCRRQVGIHGTTILLSMPCPGRLSTCKEPNNHDDDGDEKDNNGDAVHAVHEEDIRIAGLVLVAFFEE